MAQTLVLVYHSNPYTLLGGFPSLGKESESTGSFLIDYEWVTVAANQLGEKKTNIAMIQGMKAWNARSSYFSRIVQIGW